MSKWLLVSAEVAPGVLGASLTRYLPIMGIQRVLTVEARAEFLFRSASTLSKLYVVVSANSRSDATTVRLRKNGANGNQLVTIPAGATGAFEDPVNSDSFLISGDTAATQVVTGAGAGSITITLISYIHEDTSDNAIIGFCLTFALTTGFFSLFTGNAYSYGTESPTQYRIRQSAIFSRLRVRINSNTRNGTTTMTLRVNGADTALSISVPALGTGEYEDTTNSISVLPGDLVDLYCVRGGAAGALTMDVLQLMVTSPSRPQGVDLGADPSAGRVGFGQTRFLPLEDTGFGDVEAEAQVKAREPFTARNYFALVESNSLNAAATIALRLNGVNTALSITIPASATGAFENVSDTVQVRSSDLVNHVGDGSAATLGGISFYLIALEQGSKAFRSPTRTEVPSRTSVGVAASAVPRSSADP